MEAKKNRTGMNIGLMALMGLVSVLTFGTMAASASIVTDIPAAVNTALLGGSSLYAARAILTAAIMMSAGMTLAMLKMPPVGIFVVLLMVLGALTAIAWADISFLIMAALLIVAMFTRTIWEYIGGKSSGAE
jgi:hypothetical protein